MNKKNLQFCRYYKGENVCPQGVNPTFWQLEKDFVSTPEEEIPDFADNLSEYSNYGLDSFNQTDGTPLALKVLLFNRFSHWNRPNAQEFKTWYLTAYLQQK